MVPTPVVAIRCTLNTRTESNPIFVNYLMGLARLSKLQRNSSLKKWFYFLYPLMIFPIFPFKISWILIF